MYICIYIAICHACPADNYQPQTFVFVEWTPTSMSAGDAVIRAPKDQPCGM